uniref:Uncharacterized protein n=1 Tax=Peromyscus maniculatus bairdii TaxID=230844 RepID=A0A8C8UIT9_PERMB
MMKSDGPGTSPSARRDHLRLCFRYNQTSPAGPLPRTRGILDSFCSHLWLGVIRVQYTLFLAVSGEE